MVEFRGHASRRAHHHKEQYTVGYTVRMIHVKQK